MEKSGFTGQELQEYDKAIAVYRKKAESIIIKNADDNQNMTNLIAEVVKKKKEIKAKRDAIVSPIKNSIKLIDEEMNKVLKPLELIEDLGKKAIGNYYLAEKEKERKEEEKARKEAEEKIRKENLAKKMASKNELTSELAKARVEEITDKAMEKVREVKTATISDKGTHVVTRMIWSYEVEDEKKVPREYLQINPSAISTAVRNGVREIAGVKIFEKPSIAVGGKSFEVK